MLRLGLGVGAPIDLAMDADTCGDYYVRIETEWVYGRYWHCIVTRSVAL